MPAETVERLKARAKKNHRSLQGELRALIDDVTGRKQSMTIEEASQHVQSLGLKTGDEATGWIREDRDSR